MNKVELIDAISGKVGVSKRETEDIINTLIDVIVAKLKQGGEVTLTGFGAFSARTRKGRIGVNPRNPSEKIEIPSVVVPKFKAGKNLKEALKGGGSDSAKSSPAPEAPKEPEESAESTPEASE